MTHPTDQSQPRLDIESSLNLYASALGDYFDARRVRDGLRASLALRMGLMEKKLAEAQSACEEAKERIADLEAQRRGLIGACELNKRERDEALANYERCAKGSQQTLRNLDEVFKERDEARAALAAGAGAKLRELRDRCHAAAMEWKGNAETNSSNTPYWRGRQWAAEWAAQEIDRCVLADALAATPEPQAAAPDEVTPAEEESIVNYVREKSRGTPHEMKEPQARELLLVWSGYHDRISITAPPTCVDGLLQVHVERAPRTTQQSAWSCEVCGAGEAARQRDILARSLVDDDACCCCGIKRAKEKADAPPREPGAKQGAVVESEIDEPLVDELKRHFRAMARTAAQEAVQEIMGTPELREAVDRLARRIEGGR